MWDASAIPQLLMDGVNAYVYATGIAPAEQVNLATGAITYLVTDLHGSVRGTVSQAGTLAATTTYDAWGNPETPGGLTAATPFGYAGGYTDATGLVYLINRYYSPQLGQFISVDPDLADTLQPYAYANGDPVMNSDPTGLDSHEPVCKYSLGGWAIEVCITTDDDGFLHGIWWANVTFIPEAGNIQEIAASSIGMNETGEGPRPKNPNAGSRKGVRNNISATKRKNCFRGRCAWTVPSELNSGDFGSGVDPGGAWNWVHSWVIGAWAKNTNGWKSQPVSVDNGWMQTCNPKNGCGG